MEKPLYIIATHWNPSLHYSSRTTEVEVSWHLPIITEDQKLWIHCCENLTISGYVRKEKGMEG
jgi:hypothetical protein